MHPVVRLVAALLCWATCAAAGQQAFEGRRLAEALRVLQQLGLRIVFSSEIVTPDMRVAREPPATTPRRQLDELLAPHGLRAVSGPAGVILVVRQPALAPTRGPGEPRLPASSTAVAKTPPDGRQSLDYVDRVTVWGSRHGWQNEGASDVTLDAAALRAAGGARDGALDAVQVMPRVAAADDFRSEFSVRASPFRQIGIVVDGVPARWLQHALYGRGDAGSLSMLASGAVGDVTLRAGAYPRRYGDALGAQLELTVKEGARESTQWRAAVGRATAAFAGEGPIGAAARGSWTAGVRNSFRAWPTTRLSANDVGFAFADAHAKLVFDVRPSQRISVTALGGRSTLESPDEPMIGPLIDGVTRAGLVTAEWQSIVGADTVLRQRAYVSGRSISSRAQSDRIGGRSDDQLLGYRSEFLRALPGGLLDAGVEVSRMSGTREGNADAGNSLRDSFGATWLTRSAYVNVAHGLPGGVFLETGVRVSDSALVQHRAVAPWMAGSWQVAPDWKLSVSAGASRQFADLETAAGPAGSAELRPERATHVDVAIEQRVAAGVRWQATLFSRIEDDGLQAPDLYPRREQGVIVDPPPAAARYRNALHGRIRGVEVLVARDHEARLSGWLSYAYARARQTDRGEDESYWSEADRRHSLNLAGVFRLTGRSSLGVVVRGGSGVPIPGCFDLRNGTPVVGERRNETRLPGYVRVDARVERTLVSSRPQVMLVGEVLNVLNRRNQGLAAAVVDPITGAAGGLTRPLLSRRAFIGLEVTLAR